MSGKRPAGENAKKPAGTKCVRGGRSSSVGLTAPTSGFARRATSLKKYMRTIRMGIMMIIFGIGNVRRYPVAAWAYWFNIIHFLYEGGLTYPPGLNQCVLGSLGGFAFLSRRILYKRNKKTGGSFILADLYVYQICIFCFDDSLYSCNLHLYVK